MGDKIKFALALFLLAVGIAGFYLLSERAMILRVLSVLGGIGASVIVAWQTALGRRFFDFAKESVNEAKKVVWPTQKETLQMTGLVFVFAVVMAAFLWMTDKGIEWVLYELILQWRKV